MKNRVLTYFYRQSKPKIVLLGFTTAIVLALFDYWTGHEISFAFFYLIPVMFTAWFAGRKNGIIVSLFCMVSWQIANQFAGQSNSSWVIFYWNSLIRLGYFLSTAILAAMLRKSIDEERAHLQTDFLAGSLNKAILESISDGVITINLDFHVTSLNRAAEEMTGILRSSVIGKPFSISFSECFAEIGILLEKTISSKKAVVGKSMYITDVKGVRIPISLSTTVLKSSTGQIIGGALTFRDLSEVEELRRELEARSTIGELESHSKIMKKIFDILPAISTSPSTVLITGETGTGKEVLARTIHSLSSRADGPFIAVNCAALPDLLLESELFGYKAGAFTGANRNKPGRFSIAKGGTIFLDEIGEISPAMQIKLLRVLQDQKYEALGSNQPEFADVRIILATNKDLSEMVRKGAFRQDLYYRINVVKIHLPTLRNRMEDIPLLTTQFIERFNRNQRRNVKGVTADTLSLLMAHDWPGNIRELENTIERAFILCEDDMINLSHLPDELISRVYSDKGSVAPNSITAPLEEDEIRKTLEKTNYNKLAAAKLLGIHKSTLFRKMKKFEIKMNQSKSKTKR